MMGEGRFIASKTIEVALNDGIRRITGERVFLALGSRATLPNIQGLAAAEPMTHIEALDLDRLPDLSLPKIRSEGQVAQNRILCCPMFEWLKQLAYALSLRFKSRARLEASFASRSACAMAPISA